MDINAQIIDQRIIGIVEKHADWLPKGNDEPKKKSAAFTILSMSTFLGLPLEDAAELLTDGSNDAGVDGLHFGEVDDGEFTVTLFQAKYNKRLDGLAAFGENAIEKGVNTVATLFDPNKKIALNPKLQPKIEEIRSLVSDGYIPNVRMVFCNNGKKWGQQAQTRIDQSGMPEDQVNWLHFNHDAIVNILKNTKPVSDSLQFSGEAVIEDFNFRRVLIGKVPVTAIETLFDTHGDFLLERNIRRYLGFNANRVNSAIHDTLQNDPKNFYFFNNGITIICKKFRHNALQGNNYQVKLEDMQVINGGQTCKTIQKTLKNSKNKDVLGDAFVLVRIYELEDDDKDFVRDITYATNSQNPVDLRDLRSNDEVQKQLEIGMKDLGYTYQRYREQGSTRGGNTVISSAVVAEAVLATWRVKPHQAKFLRREHFGKLYDTIFKDLNAAQAVLAVLIFRSVENERKRPTMENPPDFLPYASHYISMLISAFLLKETETKEITHQNFPLLQNTLEENKLRYHENAIYAIGAGLEGFYAEYKDGGVSLQQLAATFRRGDMIAKLWIARDKKYN